MSDNQKIEHPFSKSAHKYTFLLFGVEVIAILIFFFGLQGYNFFITNSFTDAIIISLGLLTFVSVFFGFVFKEGINLLILFNNSMERYRDDVRNKLKAKIESKTLKEEDLSIVQGIEGAITEYTRLVNPILWFLLAIFISLITIVVSLSTVQYGSFVLSVLVHLNILFTLFFVTSIAVLMIYAYPKKGE